MPNLTEQVDAVAVPGPFRYEAFKVRDARGRILASLHMSSRISTSAIDDIGKLFAASWDLRELLRHALSCSGTPIDCETCKEATERLIHA